MATCNIAGLNLNVLLVSKPSTISTISLSITTVHVPMMLFILSVKTNQTDGAVQQIHNTGTIIALRTCVFELYETCRFHQANIYEPSKRGLMS